jgi:hypothetical protein
MAQGDAAGGGPSHTVHNTNNSEWLLRALDELRELDHETRQHPVQSEPYLESVGRLEAKAREVFRLGDDLASGHQADDDPGLDDPERP